MSGGDFLFIFSFIILPTAILVSSIWALIAIRAGVLLPPRPAMDLDEEYDVSEEPVAEPVDERVIVTPEQPATERPAATAAAPIEPTVPVAVSPAPDGESTSIETGTIIEPDTSRPLTPSGARHDNADSPAEQTMEMDALEVPAGGTPAPVSAPTLTVPPNVTVNASDTSGDPQIALPPTPTVQSPPVRQASAPIPDDLDVVFVSGNRTVATPTSATNRERQDGTEPMVVEQAQDETPYDAIVADDLSSITPDEAPSDSTTPVRGERDGGQRRGGRSLARRRQADEPEPRQRILVTPPSRRNARAGRQHRADEAASVTQDEGLVQRGDGA